MALCGIDKALFQIQCKAAFRVVKEFKTELKKNFVLGF